MTINNIVSEINSQRLEAELETLTSTQGAVQEVVEVKESEEDLTRKNLELQIQAIESIRSDYLTALDSYEKAIADAEAQFKPIKDHMESLKTIALGLYKSLPVTSHKATERFGNVVFKRKAGRKSKTYDVARVYTALVGADGDTTKFFNSVSVGVTKISSYMSDAEQFALGLYTVSQDISTTIECE